MTDPMKTQPAAVPARPAPRLDEVRRLLGRYSRSEPGRPRFARTALLAQPQRKRGD